VLVLNAGAPMLMGDWASEVSAILLAWYPGGEGGQAIADILFGDVNPSGKLPVTFARRWEDSPAYGNYPGLEGSVDYKEGFLSDTDTLIRTISRSNTPSVMDYRIPPSCTATCALFPRVPLRFQSNHQRRHQEYIVQSRIGSRPDLLACDEEFNPCSAKELKAFGRFTLSRARRKQSPLSSIRRPSRSSTPRRRNGR